MTPPTRPSPPTISPTSRSARAASSWPSTSSWTPRGTPAWPTTSSCWPWSGVRRERYGWARAGWMTRAWRSPRPARVCLPPAWSTRRSTSRPGSPSAPRSRATWRERSTSRRRRSPPRPGSGTRPRSATCTASTGACCCEQGRTRDAEQEFQRGLDSPDAGEGGCVRALNLLGRSLARAGAGRPGPGGPPGRARDAARAGRGGPSSPLGPLGGVRTAQMVPCMSRSKRTSSSRSPALSRWLAT